jgi:Maltokinase N-terminal cap domain
MALLHQAELRPTKLELLATWLPTRPWYRGPVDPGVTRVTSFRFDDPAGTVGIETMLISVGAGPVLQVPLTYRGAPLEGGGGRLVGTTQHSVLGERWVYDACGDPVYAAALATTILTGAAQAEEFLDVDGRLERREATVRVRGSGAGPGPVPVVATLVRVDDGDPAVILTDTVELTVPRMLDGTGPAAAGAGPSLTATWNGRSAPVVLARARTL